MQVARAGRRAGQHAAIQEPGSSTGGVPDVSSTPQASRACGQSRISPVLGSSSISLRRPRPPTLCNKFATAFPANSTHPNCTNSPNVQAGPLQQARQLQHQGSSAQQRAQQDGASASAPSSSAAEQQQPQQPEQDSSQPAAAAPPVKRVGFSLDLGAEEAAKQQNFSGVSRRKQEQLQKEQQ